MVKDLRGVLESMDEEHGLSGDFLDALKSLRKGSYVQGSLNSVVEELDESSVDISKLSIIKEKYGKGVSLFWGDIEYRYVSDVYSSEDLKKKIQVLLDKKVGARGIRNFLDKYAIVYWDSKHGARGKDGKVINSGESMKEKKNEETTSSSIAIKVDQGKVDEDENLYVVNGRVTHQVPMNEDGDVKVYEPLNENKLMDSIPEVGDTVKYKGNKYIINDIDGRYYELQPLDKRRSTITVTSGFTLVNEELNEEYDPFKDMKKLPKNTEMKKGYYTDGLGGVYEAPKDGTSKKIKIKKYQFAYDFKKRVLLVYSGSKQIDSINLNLSNWLDNPEYWCEKYIEDNLNEEELNESMSESKFNSGLKKAEASFIKKMNDLYDNYLGGIHDAAISMKRGGRDIDLGGVEDRKFCEEAKKEGQKILAYYNKSIKPRVDKFIEENGEGWNFKKPRLDYTPDAYLQLLDDIKTLETLSKIDFDKIDLDKLKNMF